jgi:hypothetical protein
LRRLTTIIILSQLFSIIPIYANAFNIKDFFPFKAGDVVTIVRTKIEEKNGKLIKDKKYAYRYYLGEQKVKGQKVFAVENKLALKENGPQRAAFIFYYIINDEGIIGYGILPLNKKRDPEVFDPPPRYFLKAPIVSGTSWNNKIVGQKSIRKIVAIGEIIETPFDSYENCIKIDIKRSYKDGRRYEGIAWYCQNYGMVKRINKHYRKDGSLKTIMDLVLKKYVRK